MSPEQKIKLQEVLAQRAEKLGVSIEELKAREQTPRFLDSARARARRLGRSVEQILDSRIVADGGLAYPTPECLDPFEVELFLQDNLPPDRKEHVRNCADCDALIEAARPDEEVILHVCGLLAAVAGEAARKRQLRDSRQINNR